MEALKSLAVISAILFFPLYYLWTRGHKKTFIAFLGTFLILPFGILASIMQGNGIAMMLSLVFMPLCFCVYFAFNFVLKHRERILADAKEAVKKIIDLFKTTLAIVYVILALYFLLHVYSRFH